MISDFRLSVSSAIYKNTTLLYFNNDSRDAARHVPTGFVYLQWAVATAHSMIQ